MAGNPLSAPALASPASGAAPRHSLQIQPGPSRTRHPHGVFRFDNINVSVHSSRRTGDGLGVTLSLSAGADELNCRMTPRQARVIAEALDAAAAAAERVTKGGAQ